MISIGRMSIFASKALANGAKGRLDRGTMRTNFNLVR